MLKEFIENIKNKEVKKLNRKKNKLETNFESKIYIINYII